MKTMLWMIVLAGCSVDAVEIAGLPCPCPDGYTCTADNVCVVGQVEDAPSCLAQPKTNLMYQLTANRFGSDFVRPFGTWDANGGVVTQSSTSSKSFAPMAPGILDSAVQDYRVVAKLTSTDASNGSVDLAARVDTDVANFYHCNILPASQTLSITRNSANFDEQTLTGLSLSANTPYTLELQVVGNTLECCIREVPEAKIAPFTDPGTPLVGVPGMKTFSMTGTFESFEVYE